MAWAASLTRNAQSEPTSSISDLARQRRAAAGFGDQLVEARDAGRRPRAYRSGRNCIDPDAAGPEFSRKVADGRFERGLHRAHHAVVRDHLGGAEIGHGEQRAALVHQRFGEPRHAHERMA